jgi:uncharacterized membrane protein
MGKVFKMKDWNIIGQLLNEGMEGDVLEWGAILIVIVIVGFIAIVLMRKYLWKSDAAGEYDTGFSLSDLREMRDRGEITSQEYEQTRARIIAKVKGAGSAKKGPFPPPQPPDSAGNESAD